MSEIYYLLLYICIFIFEVYEIMGYFVIVFVDKLYCFLIVLESVLVSVRIFFVDVIVF